MKKQQRPLDPVLAKSMTVTRMPEAEPALPRIATLDSELIGTNFSSVPAVSGTREPANKSDAEADTVVPAAVPAAEAESGGPLDKKGGAPKATFGVTSRTVAATPSNRTRTTVGIGEDVTLTTSPSTAATWAVTGAGSLASAAGNTTTFTASQTPGTATVTSTSGAETKTTRFNVIAPNGMTSKVTSNPALGTAGPPNNQIGAHTVFECTVLPVSVSFDKAQFRENIPLSNFTWPDGTAGTRSAATVPWTTVNNKTSDDVDSSLFPIARLQKVGKARNFFFHIPVPEEFQNAAGAWVAWLPKEKHLREFITSGKGRVTLEASDNVAGRWQGPWQ